MVWYHFKVDRWCFGEAVQKALEQVFVDCEADEIIRRFHFESRICTDCSSLQDTGPKVVVHPHSITGVTTETEVSDQVLWGVLQQMLYQGVTTALIPYAIHNIAEHDDWSTVVGWLGNSPFDGIPIGLYLSIMCAEDVPH